MRHGSSRAPWILNFGLLGLAGGLGAIFRHLGRQPDLSSHVPEFIAFSLFGGILYLISVYWVERFSAGPLSLVIILGSAVLFRVLLLPAPPSLSEDVYRYQWEGRIGRAGLNPYTVFPAMSELTGIESREIKSSTTTPSLYPPLSEMVFMCVKTISGYKRLFTALDLGSVGILTALLALSKRPLHRVLNYAWNPAVVFAFALCGHHDQLAIFTLLAASLLIIVGFPALSIAFLSLAVLAKFFPALLVPVFLKRSRWRYAGIVAGVVAVGYWPYLGARRDLFRGLGQYARGWEANDSLFRLMRLAGNSKAQAELVAGLMVLALVVYAIKNRLAPLDAGLLLTAAPLLLSPTAFPWYFTWSVPFLCFYPSRGWLLMSVTSVLGYAPVIAYAAGLPYRDSRFILALEYAPVIVWLAYESWSAMAGERRVLLRERKPDERGASSAG